MLIFRAFQINNYQKYFAPILSMDKMVKRVWLNIQVDAISV